MNISTAEEMSDRAVITCIKTEKNEQKQVKVSSIADRRILIVWDQEIRKKRSAKTISTSEVMEIWEANTSINRTKGYTMVILNKEIP